MNIDELIPHFKDHKLTTVVDLHKLKIYDFKRSDSGMYKQRWVLDGGTLIVTGDCFDAIYKWYGPGISLKFLLGCNLGYFSSKCVADMDGRNQTTYCEENAEEMMKTIAVDNIYINGDNDILDNILSKDWDKLDLTTKFELVKPIIIEETDCDNYDLDRMFYYEREGDAFDFMSKSENEFMFGSNAWEYKLQQKTTTPYLHLAAITAASQLYPQLFK